MPTRSLKTPASNDDREEGSAQTAAPPAARRRGRPPVVAGEKLVPVTIYVTEATLERIDFLAAEGETSADGIWAPRSRGDVTRDLITAGIDTMYDVDQIDALVEERKRPDRSYLRGPVAKQS